MIIIKSEHGNIFVVYTKQDWNSIRNLKTDTSLIFC